MSDPLQPAGVLHRWFVEYNPLYLISSAAVLTGVYLVSEDLSLTDGGIADVCLTAVTELYQAALIGAAALLYRVRRLRRPAVMLALIQVAYMCDLTFETQVAGYRGATGIITALVWLGAVPIKLGLLVWALKLQVRWSTLALVFAGAAGLVAFPLLLQQDWLTTSTERQLVAWYVFGLGAAALLLQRRVQSAEQLDDWSATVLRRAARATWAIWSVAVIGHVLWWSRSYGLHLVVLLAQVVLLLWTMRRRSELSVLANLAAAVGVAVLFDEGSVSTIAAMATAVCLLHARQGFVVEVMSAARATVADQSPYRAPPPTPAMKRQWHVVACPRMYLWASLLGYQSLWFWGWAGGALPLHSSWFAGAFILVLLVVAIRMRVIPAGLAAFALAGHLGVQQGLISAPKSNLHWGVALLSGGMALLLIAVAISWRFGQRPESPIKE